MSTLLSQKMKSNTKGSCRERIQYNKIIMRAEFKIKVKTNRERQSVNWLSEQINKN